MGKVVDSLILFHSQLQFTNSKFDLYFEDDILRGLFGESIVHLYDLVAFEIAHVVYSFNGITQMIDSVKHDFSPQQITNLTSGFDHFLFPLDHDVSDLFDPNVHDLMDDISDADMFCISTRMLSSSDSEIDTTNYLLHSLLIDLFLEHFLKNTEDNFKLLVLVLRDLHADPVQDTI